MRLMARKRVWPRLEAFSSSSETLPDLPGQKSITSASNSYVKHLVKLRTSSQYRSQAQRVLLVSEELIVEASTSTGLSSIALFISENTPLSSIPGLKAENKYTVSETVMKKITGLESVAAVGAVAEIAMPRPADFSAVKPKKLLVLDRIQDPGNIGTIFRSALAFGWDGIFLLDGCADPYGDKAIRASRGASLRLRLSKGSIEDLLQLTSDMALFSAEPVEGSIQRVRDTPLNLQRIALVLGSEGEGVSEELKKHCIPLSIPMANEMESLNVSVAGGILMFLMSDLSVSTLLSERVERLGRPKSIK